MPEDVAPAMDAPPPEVRGLKQLLCSLGLDERLGAATAFCLAEGAVCVRLGSLQSVTSPAATEAWHVLLTLCRYAHASPMHRRTMPR